MTLRLAASAVVVLFCLAGCERSAQPVEAKTAPEASAPTVADATPPAVEAPAVVGGAAPAAADGAPSFAVLYPGAQVDGQPLAAGGEAGPGEPSRASAIGCGTRSRRGGWSRISGLKFRKPT